MRIISINTNGIRAAARKGFYDWMLRQRADVVCIQETKAQEHQLNERIYHPPSLHAFFHDAEKKGYSGVALYCREQPDRVVYGLGWDDFDAEGRFIQADYGELSIVSLYLPSGSSSEHRQAVKYDVLERLRPVLQGFMSSGREFVICGDLNIAHRPIDLKNWRANQKNSGFLPAERAWLDWLFDEVGYVDVFRDLEPGAEHYTWWSNRGRAWEKNVGWRIDYQVATPGIASRATAATIYKRKRFSDHAPLSIDYAHGITP